MEIDNGRERTAPIRLRQITLDGGARHFCHRLGPLAGETLLELSNSVSSAVELNQFVCRRASSLGAKGYCEDCHGDACDNSVAHLSRSERAVIFKLRHRQLRYRERSCLRGGSRAHPSDGS